MKKIMLVLLICVCLAGCMDNTKRKDGARMVKATGEILWLL